MTAKRKVFAVLSAVVLSLVAGCASRQAVASIPRGGADAASRAFTIATFNVRCPGDKKELHWRRRMPRCAAIVRERGFDVFGVQEATDAELKLLRENLPGFASVGCGREWNRRGEGMYIFYRESRFECLGSGTFWLSATPYLPGSKYWGAGCPRTCTWARLRDRLTGREFTHFNTHLDHVSERARIDGARVLLERGVRPAKARGETVFLTGDMNATADDVVCGSREGRETLDERRARLMSSVPRQKPRVYRLASHATNHQPPTNPVALVMTELRDTCAASETGHRGAWGTYHGFTGEPKYRIDYVFSTPDVRIISHETVEDRPGGQFASDHFPVSAVVELPR